MSIVSSLTSKIKKAASTVKSALTGKSQGASVASSQQPKITVPSTPAGPQSRLPSALDSYTSGNTNTSYGKNSAVITAGKKGDATVRAAMPQGSSSVQNTINSATGGKSGGQSILPGTPGGQSMIPPKSSSSSRSSGGSSQPSGPAQSGAAGTGGFNTANTTPALGDYGSRLFAASAGGGGGSSWGPTAPNGGTPSYTGTLSSVGGLGAPTVSMNTADEQNKNDQGPVQSSVIGGGANPPKDTLASMIELSTANPSLATPNLGTTFNAADISAGLNTKPLTRETIGAELERIKTEALRIKATLDAGLTPEPVVDTMEQLQFIQDSGDPYGISQAMDNYRRQETSLMQLQSQRQEVFNGINAITQSYEAIYDDIRKNPDLPKGLAKRRLEDLYTRQKGVLDNYTQMLGQLDASIDDQNGMVNRAFNIVENSQSQEEKAQARKMQYLNFYVSSGAIGGMSDADITELASAVGVSPAGLKRVRDVKLKEDQKKNLDITQLDNGDTVVIDKDTGKIVSNLGGRKIDAGGGSSSYASGTPQGNLSNQFEIVVGNAGSVAAMDSARAHFNSLMKQGNTIEAQKYVDTLAMKGLSASDRTRFTGFGIISRVREQVRGLESGFEKTNPGLYKTLLESSKPFVGASTDPKWQTFVANVQSAVNAYRNEIFGASLTGNELKAANISLPNWNRDTFGTIVNKLDSMQNYAETVRSSLMQDAAGNFATNSLAGGQTQTTPTQTSLPGEDKFLEKVQPKAEGGYWSNLLSALNPFN